MKKGLLITHNDMDAAGCAIVSSLLTDECYVSIDFTIEYCPASGADDALERYKSNIENGEYDYIFIADISISEKMAYFLDNTQKEKSFTLGLFDHHKSNKLGINFDWYYVNTDNVSACWIMYQKLIELNFDYTNKYHDKIKITLSETKIDYTRWLMKSISRYDTWCWKTRPSSIQYFEKEFANICKFIGTERFYEVMSDFILSSSDKSLKLNNMPSNFIYLSKVLKEKESDVISNIKNKLDNIRTTVIDGYKCALLMDTSSNLIYSNDILQEVYQQPNIDIAIMLYPESRTISLRTNHDEIDLSSWTAKMFGGGGHPKAAGAKLSSSKFIEIMNTYYKSKEDD